MVIIDVKQHDISACFACATSATCPVDEGVSIVYIQLDNNVDVIDVESTGRHVCCHQNHIGVWPAKVLQYPQPCTLL